MGHRFFADENFPQPAVERLRERGHDVLTVPESGYSGRAWPDEEVLRYAISTDRAVLTLNRRHFIRLHAQIPDHLGIVVCLYQPDFRTLADKIHEKTLESASLRGLLVRVHRGG
jgi:hypothetical protein